MSITQKDLAKILSHGPEIDNLKQKVAGLNYFMIGMVVVLFIFTIGLAVGFDGIIIDGFRSKEASYQDLNDKINTLISTNRSQQITDLQGQIDNLKKNNSYLK